MIRTRPMAAISTTLALLFSTPGAIPAVGTDPPSSGEPGSGPSRPAGSPGPVGGGLFAAAPTGDAHCQATGFDGPGLSEVSLDQWKVVARGELGDPPTEPVVVALPDGPAIRLDLLASYSTVAPYWPEPTVPWSADPVAYAHLTDYFILAAHRAALLECQLPAPMGPPDDHWLSIAETVEFLTPGSPSSSRSMSPSPSAVGSDLAGPTPAASPCDPSTQDPSGSGYFDCWLSARAHAVALVLATDPRFADLPDYERLALRASSEFSLLPLLGSHYRVLSTDAELSQYGFWTPRSGLIEVTLAKDCVEPTSDPAPDPCGWRHSWYYRVEPDDTVTLLYDEGDPDDG